MKRVLALLFFILPFSAQAQMPSFSTWANNRGSLMSVFFVDPATGAFTGTYLNNAAGFDCRGVPYPVSGATKGSRVTFTVNWKGILVPDCHSTTVWRGRFVGPALRTRWILNYVGSDGRPHVLRGADVFTKQ